MVKNSHTYATLEENIQLTISSLETLVKKNCWNKISNNYLYILSDINAFEYADFHEQRKISNKINNSKIPLKIDFVLKALSEIYVDLYDVNFYVFKAKKNVTVIWIQYYKKSNLDTDFFVKVKNNPPMYHAKISLPPYRKNDSDKFDINWNTGGFMNQIRLLMWKIFD